MSFTREIWNVFRRDGEGIASWSIICVTKIIRCQINKIYLKLMRARCAIGTRSSHLRTKRKLPIYWSYHITCRVRQMRRHTAYTRKKLYWRRSKHWTSHSSASATKEQSERYAHTFTGLLFKYRLLGMNNEITLTMHRCLFLDRWSDKTVRSHSEWSATAKKTKYVARRYLLKKRRVEMSTSLYLLKLIAIGRSKLHYLYLLRQWERYRRRERR